LALNKKEFMKVLKHIVFAIVSMLLLQSCDVSSGGDVDVSGIKVDSELVRFDSVFYNSDPSSFSDLQNKYPLMLPIETPDSVWKNKIENKHDREVYAKAVNVFGDFTKEYIEIIDVLKHVKYYYPKFEEPDIYTILSDFDYQYSVLYTSKRLFVSLDMYLGTEEEEYKMFPKYLVDNMIPERIKVDVADAIGRKIVAKDKYDRTLLSKMIYEGKLLYLVQKLIPTSSEDLLIGYSKSDLEWCKVNEKYIWTYMIKKKYIYSTDDRLFPRFINVAPFTKFYLELDRESPGRVGVWLGWQIVKSYMENNDVTLQELMNDTDAKGIFIKSKYKPSK
jgi:gliding motility-associated lipoprotein GldB